MSILVDFSSRFATFDQSVVDASLPCLIDNYRCYYNFDYVDCHKEAILQLLAHLLVIDTKTSPNPVKGVNSRSAEGVSVSYAEYNTGGQADSFFTTTRYGQAFLRLTRFRYGARFV